MVPGGLTVPFEPPHERIKQSFNVSQRNIHHLVYAREILVATIRAIVNEETSFGLLPALLRVLIVRR